MIWQRGNDFWHAFGIFQPLTLPGVGTNATLFCFLQANLWVLHQSKHIASVVRRAMELTWFTGCCYCSLSEVVVISKWHNPHGILLRHSFWVLKIAFQLLNDHIGFYSCNVEATFLFELFFEHENTTEIRQIVVANSRTLLSHQRAIINFELKLNCNPLLWNFHSILEVSSWESCYFQIITLPKSYVSS